MLILLDRVIGTTQLPGKQLGWTEYCMATGSEGVQCPVGELDAGTRVGAEVDTKPQGYTTAGTNDRTPCRRLSRSRRGGSLANIDRLSEAVSVEGRQIPCQVS